jgi:hypothetical protein
MDRDETNLGHGGAKMMNAEIKSGFLDDGLYDT